MESLVLTGSRELVSGARSNSPQMGSRTMGVGWPRQQSHSREGHAGAVPSYGARRPGHGKVHLFQLKPASQSALA